MKCNMNYKDSYKYEDPMPEKEACKPHPRPQPQTETILKCGTSMGSTPLCCYGGGIGVDGGYDRHPPVLATVALDTSELINPAVKIDFSSLISFKTCGDDNYLLHLVFKLSKVCGGHPIPLGTWTFEQIHHENDRAAQSDGGEFVQETDPFCFSWCECDDCPDCCRYVIEIVEQQCYNIKFATISNISLAAMAVGLKKVY